MYEREKKENISQSISKDYRSSSMLNQQIIYISLHLIRGRFLKNFVIFLEYLILHNTKPKERKEKKIAPKNHYS